MKFLRLSVLLIVGALLYQSCSSNFNPSAPYKNIAVVYGLINISDSIHYIKIEKAFLTQTGGNAYTAAQVGDSIYYPTENINAYLQAYNNTNGSLSNPIGNIIPLTRIDGATIGLNKDTGVFVSNPNIVYYTKAHLDGAYTYQLVINNSQTGKTTTAQTALVDSFSITNPTYFYPVNFDSRYIYSVSWTPATNAALYQLVVRFHYNEYPINNHADSSSHYLTWTFSPEPSSTNSTQQYQYITGKSFYTFVASQIPVNATVERKPVSFDFWFYAGGSQLYTYQQVTIANSTSLVQGQINPSYTDINNGIGLFSSTLFQAENNLSVSSTTLDSLAHSPITQSLNFLDRFGNL